MRYLVMECHPAYVVVLDEEGRFLKAANMHYQVGQYLSDIIALKQPNSEAPLRHIRQRRAVIASMAACICLVLLTSYTLAFGTYGTVRLQINPDIELMVNRFDYVIRAQGLNEDGRTLLENWSCSFKKIDEAAGQLTKKAGEDGFLKEDGTVRVTVTSRHSQWRDDIEQQLVLTLQDRTEGTINIIPISPSDADDIGLTDPDNLDDTDDLDDDLEDPDDDDADEDVEDDLEDHDDDDQDKDFDDDLEDPDDDDGDEDLDDDLENPDGDDGDDDLKSQD